MKRKRKKKKRKKTFTLHELVEQWTRAEVMARMAPLGITDTTEYAMLEVELRDRVREHAFGTSDLVELGDLFKLPLRPRRRKKKKKRRKHVR